MASPRQRGGIWRGSAHWRAVTLGNVAAGLAFVGGVTSALGGITGNKKLMKFGMIAGVAGLAVGGISALANSAGRGIQVRPDSRSRRSRRALPRLQPMSGCRLSAPASMVLRCA